MFKKDQFQFQSPNALDAGDLPPSAPARRVNDQHPASPPTPEHRIINTSMSFQDARDNATDFLKDIEVSPTRVPGAAHTSRDQFYDEEEDGIYCNDDDSQLRKALSPPTLNDEGRPRASWRRPSRQARQLYSPSSRGIIVPSSRGMNVNLHDLSNLNQEESGPFFNKKICLFFCICPIVLIILVSIAMARTFNAEAIAKNDQLIPKKAFLSERLLNTIDMLIASNISNLKDLEVQGTPQNLAAEWMANVDPLQYKIPYQGMAFEEAYHFIQRYVLAVLFFATGGSESWTDDLDFLSGNHECGWFHRKEFTDGQTYAMGVTCRADDLVISDLLIPANNLQGSLPSELAFLPSLIFLSLSHNELMGGIPNLSDLTNLEYLDLGANKLSGSIPDWISSWSGLKVLGLENNRLSGTIPESIASLTDLITLDLKKNSLRGSIDVVNGLYNLEYLYLGSNGFSGYIDSQLFLLGQKQLREVDISNNLFYGDEFPHELLLKPALQLLDLSENSLAGSIPQSIAKNTVLEALSINGNSFTGTIPSAIDSLVNLRHLDMRMNKFQGTIPDRLVNLHQLTYLSLGENEFIPSPIPAFLSSFTQLRELSLARSNIVGTIPQWFDILTNLRFLNLQENNIQGEVPQEVWNLPELSIVLLSGNNLNGTLPETTANAKNLEILAVSKTNIGGEADTICYTAPSLVAFTFDCAQVSCTTECCNVCCNPPAGEDTSSCFSKQLMTGLGREQNEWEFKYQSSGYSFSPNIIFAEDARAGPRLDNNS